MKLKIAVLPGDGIGPEIMKQGVAVMDAIAKKFNHEFTYNEALCGAHAIDAVGDPFPEETFKTCMDADAVLFLVDASTPAGKGDKWIVENLLKTTKIPIIIVMNKVDKIKNSAKIEENLLSYKTLFEENVPIIRISAKTGRNKDTLLSNIYKKLPQGEMLYPDDVVTEETMRSIAEEIVREKILMNTQDEIPHSVAITIDKYEEKDDIDKIFATIYCEQKSQKGIIIGKGGSLLKKIGTEARLELEKIVDKKVFLSLEVKVAKDWRKKDKNLKAFGYTSDES